MQDPQSVLLVEDNPDDVRLVQEALRGVSDARFLLDRVDRLASAVDWLRRRAPSAVLLDLNLPDSKGLDTLVVLRTHAPRTAIVVFTVRPQDEGPRAIRAGAQDYLAKAPLHGELLARSIRYAIERQSLLNELQRRHAQELRTRDLEALEDWGTSLAGRRPGRTADGAALRQSAHDLFRILVRRYGEVVEHAADAEQLSPPDIERIEDVAARLAVLNASPADAVELHTVALEIRAQALGPVDPAGAMEHRGGLLLLELLSALTEAYRRYAADVYQMNA